VQPDRACYIRRAADELLIEAIAAQQFAWVLAPRALGKSSLMGRTIRRLRADGQLAAVVDLAQIGARGENVDAARWHYSIAYRICRELRLKVDLQAWWHDKSLLVSEQRLVEFFWDVVLANTESAVTIFFDEIERAIEPKFAPELSAALYSCLMRRVSEPDFARLNFVVLGAAAPAQLCPDPGVSPFVVGRAIPLEDFTLEECAGLAPGLGRVQADARAAIARIHGFTHGQPYLTQKLARGVARKGGRPADVDAARHELFLAPGISREEPLLNHMRSLLTGSSPRRRQAVAIVGRLARGQEVIDDPASQAQLLLRFAGLTSSDDNGMLRFRNRIVEHVFGGDWARSEEPRRWQRPAAIAASSVAAVGLVLFWYTQMLPARDVETLRQVSSDYGLAEQAHARLRRLPGFGRVADRLWGEAMVRRSTGAESIDEIRAADRVLRGLPGHEALADELLAAFWLRRARTAAGAGDRDAALVQALAAAGAGSAEATRVAANLIDGDYASLERSYRLDAPPVAVEVDWEREEIVVVDETRRVRRLPLVAGAGTGAGPRRADERTLATRLTALQHGGVTRELFVEETGRAGAFDLVLTLEHGRTSDLLVRLRAPSGAAAEVALPARDGRYERFVLAAAGQDGLARLADEPIVGQWELTLFDRLSGESGRLVSWALSFPGLAPDRVDAPAGGLPLPDPGRTGQIEVAVAANGRLAAAVPARADARGAVAVFDLSTGELIADLPLADRADLVRFVAPERLLVASSRRATLWDLAARTPVIDLVSAQGFAGPPALGADGRFIAFTEPARAGALIRLYRVDDGTAAGRLDTGAWHDFALGPDAIWVAALDGRRGHVLDPSTGATVAEFFHERELERIVPTRAADRVVTVDRDGRIHAWPLTGERGTLGPRDSLYLGTTAAADRVAPTGDGGLAFPAANGIVIVRGPDGLERAALGHGANEELDLRPGPAAGDLVSVAGSLIRYWRLGGEEPFGADFGDVSAVALEAEGRFAVLGDRAGQVRFLPELPASIASGAATAAVTGHGGAVTSLAVSASGGLAASGSSDGVVRVWNTATGSRSPSVVRHPTGPIGALAFSPDERWLVSAGATSARVFDLEQNSLSSEIEVEGEPLAVAFSADSRLVAVGDSAGNIFLAAPDGTAGIFTIRGRSPITALAFADLPELLASGSEDGDLVLWDTISAQAIEGAHRFAAPIGWIGIAPGAGAIHVQSGSWLHTLDRSDPARGIGASLLLPDRLRSEPALALTPTGALRGLASLGGGRLALADLGPAVSEAAAADLPDRDWARVLGLELDPVTGAIRELGR